MKAAGAGRCRDCGDDGANVVLDGVELCDRCADRRTAALTGFAPLPEPPAPIRLVDAVGRPHTLVFRIWRSPTGIEVELVEHGRGNPHGGYRFAVLGAHDADVATLVDAVVARATEALAAGPQLEPNPHRAGWLPSGDQLVGRLEWGPDREDGGPYDAIVDGRRLSWDELGRAMEPFEGWRFRLVIEDPCDDLRPDADLIAFPNTTVEDAATMTDSAAPSIDVLLDAFLAEEEQRLAPRTFRNYATIVELLRDCLNHYGYQSLDAREQARLQAAYADDDQAFVRLFGADQILDNLGEFLGYFMVRKVMAGEELLRAAGTVTKRLAKWLGAHGHIGAGSEAIAVERAADAGRDLPNAERLASVLCDHAAAATVDVADVGDDDYVDDYLAIERVEPGRLWFEGGLGPVAVPEAATKLAVPGWTVYVVLARHGGTWHLVEVGNVYP